MNPMSLGAANPDEEKDALAELSELTGQPVANISQDDLRKYLVWRAQQDSDLQTAIAQADREEFASTDEVAAVFARYGA